MMESALAFTVMGVFAKLAGQSLPVAEIVFARGIVSLVLSLATLRRAGVSPWGIQRRRLVVRGLIGASGLGCLFYALRSLPLA